jgi:hypothetical protein
MPHYWLQCSGSAGSGRLEYVWWGCAGLVGGGRGRRTMESAYQEQERRKEMLRAVLAWIEQRGDLRETLSYETVSVLVESPADPDDDRQQFMKDMDDNIALFQTLVNEGYINAELKGEAKTGAPFSYAIVHGLRDKGHQLINTLPDPRQELLQRLDAIEEAIRTLQDPNVSEEQKEEAKKAVGTLRQFSLGFASSGTYDLLIRSLTGGF